MVCQQYDEAEIRRILMDFEMGNSFFTGRYAIDRIDRIEDWPGLYSILCYRNGEYYMIDVGESDNVRSAVENNGRREFWERRCSGTLVVTVYYTSDMQRSERERLEREIRKFVSHQGINYEDGRKRTRRRDSSLYSQRR